MTKDAPKIEGYVVEPLGSRCLRLLSLNGLPLFVCRVGEDRGREEVQSALSEAADRHLASREAEAARARYERRGSAGLRPLSRKNGTAPARSTRTVGVARSLGREVVEVRDDPHKKAGALNQVLGETLPGLKDEDMVLVMDADSSLDERFIECAQERLAQERLAARGSSTGGYGGVGGTFQGRPGGGFVGILQRNEYARYARDVRRLKGKVLCLTGTATLFSAKALRDVAAKRPTGNVGRANFDLLEAPGSCLHESTSKEAGGEAHPFRRESARARTDGDV